MKRELKLRPLPYVKSPFWLYTLPDLDGSIENAEGFGVRSNNIKLLLFNYRANDETFIAPSIDQDAIGIIGLTIMMPDYYDLLWPDFSDLFCTRYFAMANATADERLFRRYTTSRIASTYSNTAGSSEVVLHLL